MKVLVVSKSFTKGGSASGASNLAQALNAAGAEVVRVDAQEAIAGRPLAAVRFVERVYERLAHDAETHCLRLGPASVDLLALCKIHKPDVVQLCDISANTISFKALRRLPCPVFHRMSDFWPYHGARHYAPSPPTRPALADRVLRWTAFSGAPVPDIRVAPSHWLADHLVSGGVARDRLRVIRNAVTSPDEVQPRAHCAPGLRLGFIAGSITDPRKGFKNLLPFLAALPGGAQVHLYGHPSKTDLPAVPGIEWVSGGRFTRDQKAGVYGSFDILLCPSLLDNSPNVLTEAFSFGVPVIAQSGTGMDSYVLPGTGALIDFKHLTSSALERFNASVAEIVSTYTACSAAALSSARDDLAPAVIGAAYLNLYHEILTQRHD
ncbi:glycosyltransferase [Pararhodobacter zhoushanensis]|uniref:Glycosyltransferase n=1 Tax=Pararhodobacter zhoushanensis TaxID=2479545 RepID=A0ABT3H1Q5_9RHOB|nr:glycosyltransferase [Pararhodobacter zhoushanensis]MCW1933779.1 glycosyltransferase [Pararhodobacter zhoushanensis]